MATDRPLSADELREVLHAETKLAELDLYADVAAAVETEPSSELRSRYADEYRRVVGVPAENRGQFRTSLEAIRDGNGDSVENVVARLNATNQANGLGD